MVTRRWVFAILLCAGLCAAENVTNPDCGVNADEDINIHILNRRLQTNIDGKETRQDESNQIKQTISKQININLNLDNLREIARQKSTMYDNNTDSPNPFYDYVRGFGYYKLHNEVKTWNEAKSICEKEGAHLAILNSKEEVQLFIEMRNRLPKTTNDWKDDTLFIGINDIVTEGTWVTIFGEPLEKTGFSEWAQGMPSKGKDGNCGIFRPSTGKLHDAGCNWTLGFYCEKSLSL